MKTNRKSPSYEGRRSQLPDIGDGLAAAFATLHADPQPDACETLAIRLQGAARHVLSLRDAVMEETGRNGQ